MIGQDKKVYVLGEVAMDEILAKLSINLSGKTHYITFM
jgi:hypothetical protein